MVNKVAGSRRTMGHGIVTPGTPGWFEKIDRVIETLKPESIKGYTIGDPMYQTKKKTNWRMDDERNWSIRCTRRCSRAASRPSASTRA